MPQSLREIINEPPYTPPFTSLTDCRTGVGLNNEGDYCFSFYLTPRKLSVVPVRFCLFYPDMDTPWDDWGTLHHLNEDVLPILGETLSEVSKFCKRLMRENGYRQKFSIEKNLFPSCLRIPRVGYRVSELNFTCKEYFSHELSRRYSAIFASPGCVPFAFQVSAMFSNGRLHDVSLFGW